MATHYDKNGIMDLTGRSWVFKFGYEINPDFDSFLKSLCTKTLTGGTAQIDLDFVERAFSPVIDAFGLHVLQSSYDRFVLWCDDEGLQCSQPDQNRMVSIRRIRLTPSDIMMHYHPNPY